MKAQDKICVAPHQISDYDLDIQEVGHNGAEEYIRKEALMKWAKQKQLDSLTIVADNFWQEVIDKLNSI